MSGESSRSVIDTIIRRGSPSRIGIYDRIWTDTLRRWVAEQGYPTETNGEPVDPHDHFGFDLVAVGGGFDPMPHAGVREVVDETDAWVVIRNGAGAMLKSWKHKSGTPEHVGFTLTSREIWDREYRHLLLDLEPARVDVEAARERLARHRAAGKWVFYQHMFIWETMRQSLGDECMYETLLVDPDWVLDYNRVYTDFYKRHFAYLIERAGKPDGVRLCEDLAYSRGLFCSPRVLEELVFPFYREIIDFFHDYELPVIFHCCGNVTEALPCLVDLGIDMLDPMERKAGCSPVEFARGFGNRIAFRGGLDVRVMESGDRDLIRREVVSLIDAVKREGARYVFSSDHSVSTGVAYQDFAYAVAVAREHSAY